MINKRLIGSVKESKKYIFANVFLQWVGLIANIVLMTTISIFISSLFLQTTTKQSSFILLGITAVTILIRFGTTLLATKMAYWASHHVKKQLRHQIYDKLLQLGSNYNQKVKTSEVVQVAVEGVEQLETYFSAYLPQLFYALLAPITLFVFLSFVNFPSALVLFVCVPLIPVSIILVQKWAKKLLSKYWSQYTSLGDSFLENLQGLTTLKIYQADQFKQEQMNQESEHFRKITMRVLIMQLNSISIMDLIAYGGAALGVILACTQYQAERVSLAGCILIILLSADFFIPMRLLGSFFHIAMNGMAASDKIFKILDLPVEQKQNKKLGDTLEIQCKELRFCYEQDREILHGLNMQFPEGTFTAIVGESGSGKSTISSILMGKSKTYQGSVTIGGVEQKEVDGEDLLQHITYIGHQSYLFKGTVAENLRMAKQTATDEELWQVLDKVNLADFLKNEDGLHTLLTEKASNFSGGQRQRLALARALLHNSPVYIFDEATSNIDVESENSIMKQIYQLAKEKTVILISHRLANVTGADNIYVLDQGRIVQQGTHKQLVQQQGHYQNLWQAQQSLEQYQKGGQAE